MKKIVAITASFIISFSAFSAEHFVLPTLKTGNTGFKLKSDDDDNGIKGKFIVTAGVGMNFAKLNYTLRYELSDYFTNIGDGPMVTDVSFTPMLNAAIDYGIGKRFTVGLAVGFQKTDVYWREDYYYNVNVIDHWKRLHFAVRGDYWIVAEDNIGVYTGLKVGINQYAMTSSNFTKYDPYYDDRLDVNFSPVSVQAHFGFNYWFAKVVGLNAEIGIGVGGPYFFAAGVTGKF